MTKILSASFTWPGLVTIFLCRTRPWNIYQVRSILGNPENSSINEDLRLDPPFSVVFVPFLGERIKYWLLDLGGLREDFN